MSRMLRADLERLMKSPALRLSLAGMLALSLAFMGMQATAMDYVVPLSRVIFLPLSMYGAVMAACVSIFAGTDFSDGFIRNKLLSADSRRSLVLSQMAVSCLACLIVYAAVTAFTALAGRFFFENDVEAAVFFRLLVTGAGMSLVTGSLFSAAVLVCGTRTRAMAVNMGGAFGMLFLAMHTNGWLARAYKENPAAPGQGREARFALYSLLHDLNPCGQAAQLSVWEVRRPVRVLVLDLALVLVLAVLACAVFRRKDVD